MMFDEKSQSVNCRANFGLPVPLFAATAAASSLVGGVMSALHAVTRVSTAARGTYSVRFTRHLLSSGARTFAGVMCLATDARCEWRRRRNARTGGATFNALFG